MTTISEPTVGCPELEELAAFIDGKLSGAERDAVVEHLASCEACYEVYAETLRIQEDLGLDESPRAVPAEDDPPLAPVVRHPRSFGWGWRAVAAMAAALVAAVGLVWYVSLPGEQPAADLSTLMARLNQQGPSPLDGTDWYEHDWPVTRGMAPELGQSDRDAAKRAFRLGVHAVDLEMAMRLENRHLAEGQTHQIESLLEGLDFAQPEIEQWRDLRDRINADEARQEILASASGLERELTEGEYALVDRFYFSFGVWVEKSRLIALLGQGPYFGEREFKEFLRRLGKAKLGKEVTRQVAVVRRLVSSEPISQEELIGALKGIIKLEGVG